MSFRTSLQRLTRRDPAAPSLRQRLAFATANLAETKERAGKAAKVAQTLMAPPEPATEQISAGDTLVADIIACWADGAAIPEENREDGDPLYERWWDRRGALINAAEALPATPDGLTAKALAFTWIWEGDATTQGQARAEHATDGRLALDIDAIIRGRSSEDATASLDPFFATLTAARAANAAMDAFGPGAAKHMPEGWFEEEQALLAEQSRTQDIALSIVPTTQAGRVALADYMAELMGRYGMADGGPPEDGSSFWAFAYHALSAALRAPIRPVIPGPSGSTAAHDLSGASIRQLARLYDHLQGLADIASMACNAPMAWDDKREDHSVVGNFLEGEHARLDDLVGAVVSEIRSRTPASDSQRDDRLATIIKREMEVRNGPIDGSTLADLTAAWGR